MDEYEYQLEVVIDALIEDPENKELEELKKKLERVVIQKRFVYNLQSEADEKAEAETMKTYKVKQNKSPLITDDLSINPINWKKGDDCQATDPMDDKIYDAIIEYIIPDTEVMVRFKESGRVTVTKLDFLAIPKNGKCRMFKTFSAKNMNDIMTYRKEHL